MYTDSVGPVAAVAARISALNCRAQPKHGCSHLALHIPESQRSTRHSPIAAAPMMLQSVTAGVVALMAAAQLAALQCSPAAPRCPRPAGQCRAPPATPPSPCSTASPSALQPTRPSFPAPTSAAGPRWRTWQLRGGCPSACTLLLVMPELCMQATAAATSLCSPERPGVGPASVSSMQVQTTHSFKTTDLDACQ